MENPDNSISLEEAASRRGVSKRRITQQAREGGWGIRKVARGRYALCEDETCHSRHRKSKNFSDQERLEYENVFRDRLDLTEDPKERIYLICVLAEMEMDRLGPREKGPNFENEDRTLDDQEIDWLLNEPCYQVGLISSDDLKAMGSSLKKTYEAMKNFWDLNQLKLEESVWSFMALESIFDLLDHRIQRGDTRVIIAGNTGLPRK